MKLCFKGDKKQPQKLKNNKLINKQNTVSTPQTHRQLNANSPNESADFGKLIWRKHSKH